LLEQSHLLVHQQKPPRLHLKIFLASRDIKKMEQKLEQNSICMTRVTIDAVGGVPAPSKDSSVTFFSSFGDSLPGPQSDSESDMNLLEYVGK
jgi:hypothetical protein